MFWFKSIAVSLFVLFLGITPVRANNRLADDGYHEYVGTLEKDLVVGMTLQFGKDGKSLTGNYFYAEHCKEIKLEGEMDGRAVTMRELDDQGKTVATFKGEFPEKDPKGKYGDSKLEHEVLTGTWTKADGKDSRTFYFSLTHIFFSMPRYSNAGFDKDEIADAFAQNFRSAVLRADRHTVASMIAYPIKVKVGNDVQNLASKADMLKHYDAVFDAAFIQRIERTIPFHMFSRDMGVMLGNGEIWISPVEVKKNGAPMLPRVIAINR